MILLTPSIITLLLLLKLQKSIKYSHEHFSEYLANENDSAIFLQSTNQEKMANISYLNSSIFSHHIFSQIRLLSQILYLTILFFLKNEIWKQLADLFNLSFTTGVFQLVLKTLKAAPVFKKESKLDYSTYCPIAL